MAGELVVFKAENYPVLLPNSDAAMLLAENCQGENINISDLTRVRVPAGGGQFWTVPGADGEDQSLKAIEGIIVHTTKRRAMWRSPTPSAQPPDCQSTDMIRGVGDPGGICEACPFNVFGSAQKDGGGAGRGKACKENELIFMLRAGDLLPLVIVASPGSLKPMKLYKLRLKHPIRSVITRLTLEQDNNKDGIKFSKIQPVSLGPIPPDAFEAVKKYSASLEKVFAAQKSEAADNFAPVDSHEETA